MAGMSTETEVKELMERVHLEVFNQTIEQRQAEKNEINQLNEANDFQRLHIPAFLRLSIYSNTSANLSAGNVISYCSVFITCIGHIFLMEAISLIIFS